MGPYVFPRNIRSNNFCGWRQLTANDHFDWTRRRGATPSSQTGPSVDATTANGKMKINIDLKQLAYA